MDKRFIIFLNELLIEEYDKRQVDKKLVSKNIEKELQQVDKEINNVLNSFTSTQSEIVRTKLEQKIEELEYRKQMLKSQSLQGEKKDNIKTILKYATKVFENPYSIWKDCSIDDKRTFLKLVFRNDLEVNKKSESF